MPVGANKQREQEYDELVQQFKQEGRYQGREKEVAARIVNQQRARFGETQGAKAKDPTRMSTDRSFSPSRECTDCM